MENYFLLIGFEPIVTLNIIACQPVGYLITPWQIWFYTFVKIVVKCEPTLAIFYAIGKVSIVVNGQVLNKPSGHQVTLILRPWGSNFIPTTAIKTTLEINFSMTGRIRNKNLKDNSLLQSTVTASACRQIPAQNG